MNRAGIAVIGHDHPGHGRTAKPGELGEFAEKNGVRRVNGAMAQVARFAKHKFQGIPHILLGHSMGSFLDAVLSRIMENGWTAQFSWEPEASRNHFCGWAEPSWQWQRGWKEEMDEMSGCTSWFLEAITTILKKEKRNINGCRV
ncbi:MAG: alpha/beta hydrolase [Clostridium fessum]